MNKNQLLLWVLSVVLVTGAASFGQTQTPQFRLQQNYITGLTRPIVMTHAGDGSYRKFIVEQAGIIKVVPPDHQFPSVFMNITGRVNSTANEQGMLGLAFHPEFASNGYFFVNYTRADGATVISRFKAMNNNTLGDPNSERILLTIAQPATNHNSGGMRFSPIDGHLYISTGDGGGGNDPQNRAQNINTLLGKFLRITPDVSGDNTNPPYTIPPDNPYVGVVGEDEIYAIGLRNPWGWTFDRGGNRELWAADVGQSAREEVNIINKGGNYGWRVYEGTQCTGLDPSLCTPGNFTMPIFEYNRTGGRCSITGGHVYRGHQNALPRGAFIYGDLCSGEIMMWHNSVQTVLIDTNRTIAAFGEDEQGEIYVLSLQGAIDRIVGSKPKLDFDGDFRTDQSVYRPSNSTWYRVYSSNQSFDWFEFGASGDIPAPKDFDGDHIADLAVWNPASGQWSVIRSSDLTLETEIWGEPGDIPVPADYDGDGKADWAIFRPSTGVWHVMRSSDRHFIIRNWGQDGDIPLPGDYDGDGLDDMTIWRPATGEWWTVYSSTQGLGTLQFGAEGDIPAPGDYDGDGKIGQAVWRPSTGMWYIRRTLDNGILTFEWGVEGDVPVPGDYDADGRDDIGIFRPSTGIWYLLNSNWQRIPTIEWGTEGDIPLPSLGTR